MAYIFFRIYDGVFILYIYGNTCSQRSFYSKFSEKTKLWIDLVSHVVVLLPFIIVIIYHSWFFMMRAYVTAEGSIDPGGLPHRWIIKSVLVLSFVLFGIATVARSIAIIAKLRKLTGDAN